VIFATDELVKVSTTQAIVLKVEVRTGQRDKRADRVKGVMQPLSWGPHIK